ncbi:MAG: DUF3822 family protein [Daejeonella sp.]
MNKTIYLIDENFQSQHSGKCDLLIQINADSIFYAIVDKGQDQLRVLVQADFNDNTPKASVIDVIDKLLQTEAHLKYYFRKVKISVQTFKFTFIPAELYIADNIPDYAKFIKPAMETDVIVNDIKSFHIKNAFLIPTNLQNKLNSGFHKPQILSQANSFIEGARKIHSDTSNELFLNIQSKSFEAAILNDNKLLFYNIFEYQNADEFNYFLLTVLQNLNIDVNQTLITLSGEIKQSDEVYKRIEKYFANLIFADSKLLSNQSDLFSEIPSHSIFPLLSLNLCE